MKVKVKAIAPPYNDVPTASLQAILRNHAYGKLHVYIGTQQIYDIMGELVRRREITGGPFKSNEDAWEEFNRHYMPGAGEKKEG